MTLCSFKRLLFQNLEPEAKRRQNFQVEFSSFVAFLRDCGGERGRERERGGERERERERERESTNISFAYCGRAFHR